MLWTIGGILALLWLLCFFFQVEGGLIPLILAITTIVFLLKVLMRDPEFSRS